MPITTLDWPMDWGKIELPSELEIVAILTGRSWAKTAIERHKKKAKRKILESIDLPIDAR